MSTIFTLIYLFVIASTVNGATWDETLNTCNTTQTLIKSIAYTTTQTTDNCADSCQDEINQYSVANNMDYSGTQNFCCEYVKVAADRNAGYDWDYTCKSYLGDLRYD